MRISRSAWNAYIKKLSQIQIKAADLMQSYINQHGTAASNALIAYAYSLSTHYGSAAATLACEMYDATAAAQGASVPGAEPADEYTYPETAKIINGTMKKSEILISPAVSVMVKQAAADTTLKNAIRDGAEWAWVPSGGTCAYCLMLASRGWQRASRDTLNGNHAEHIHNNCDCNFCVRFDKKSNVDGYDSGKYKKIYDYADGSNTQEKINSLRKMLTGENALTVDQLDYIIDLETHPDVEFNIKPVELYNKLKSLRFNVKALNRSKSLKGVPFEDGGGFRINYGGDGYLQYHPAKGSHHGGEYYRLSRGKIGNRRFRTNGVEINE